MEHHAISNYLWMSTPFACFLPSPQRRAFIRSYAGRNIRKRNAKCVRLCQVPCQAVLLFPGPRPYNLALVVRSGSFCGRTDPHLRQQVLSTAPPHPSNLETQHYHPCCSSGFDLDLQVLDGLCLVPLPASISLTFMGGALEQSYSCSYQSPSQMIKSCLWTSLCLDFPTHSALTLLCSLHPILGFFSHVDFSHTLTYLINTVLAGWAVSWIWLSPQCMHTHHIICSIHPKDLSERRSLDQEALIEKNMIVAGLDQVLILPMDFIQHAPLPWQARVGIVLHQCGTSLSLFPNLWMRSNIVPS